MSQEVVDAVHKAKAEGHRVIAVGTTAVRSLESAFDTDAPVSPPAVTARYFEGREDGGDTLGRSDIVVRENATTQPYLMPGSTYHVVDALITNFHVPRDVYKRQGVSKELVPTKASTRSFRSLRVSMDPRFYAMVVGRVPACLLYTSLDFFWRGRLYAWRLLLIQRGIFCPR